MVEPYYGTCCNNGKERRAQKGKQEKNEANREDQLLPSPTMKSLNWARVKIT